MLRLAVSYGDKYIKLNEIAKSENIPEKFLENIVSIIKPTDLLRVKRGAEGGYKLSMPPDRIKSKEIFEALDGQILHFESSNNSTLNLTPNQKIIIDFWREIGVKLSDFLRSKTLEDLANDYKKMYEDQMFYVL